MSFNTADKNYYLLKKSVKKAVIGKEMPLKVKHVRAIIIGTYYFQGSAVFWSIVIKQPIMENRYTAWKLNHLLHKILREGHNLCCQESLDNIRFLTDLGQYWSHVRDGYGMCILEYTKLLVMKIMFHTHNPRIPGTLDMSKTEIDQISGGDINVIFQLTIEIFDYLDALMALQATIFESFELYNITAMTLEGQCRSAALIPCVEDAFYLYVLAMQFMHKLHEYLNHNILEGHRDRFKTLYPQLRSFYNRCGLQNIGCFVNIPILPAQIPSFSRVMEISDYPMPSAPPEEHTSENTLINF